MENKQVFDVRVMGTNLLYYSLIQLGIPLIESIVIDNNSEEDIHDIKINIEFEYDFVDNMEIEIGTIKKESFAECTVPLVYHARKIFELTEKIVDKVKITVLKGEEVVEVISTNINVLPPNQWSGSRLFPATIASFVMPNLPEISHIVSRAAIILKEKTGNPSFDGYLSEDKNRVLAQLSAIYAAIYEQNIVYSILPATFETIGQRVRTPQEVIQFKQANCIEMSILFASVCEAVGLNPFIVLVEKHAFVGCWLVDELFGSIIEDNVSELKKRSAAGIDDIVMLEATFMNQGSNKSFDNAISTVQDYLVPDDNFELLVDIKFSHMYGITPMPVKTVENGEITIVDYGYASDALEKAETKKNINEYFLDTSKKEEVTKSTIWMRNLLDLSKRNNLISFRPSPRNIQLFTNDIAILEDALSKGDSFTLTEVTGEIQVGRKNNRIVDVDSKTELYTEISKADFKSKKIRTYMPEDDMQFVLKNIYRETQYSIEENGASSLFLALGFLRWIDPKDPKRSNGEVFYRYAPLILVPIDLHRKSIENYQIRLRDEEPQLNITLLEFLRQNFSLSIGGLNPLPEDENGVDIPLVLNSIRKAIMSQKGWDVIETSFLGNFSFSQFVMWNDLKERFDKLTENKIVKGLVDGFYNGEYKEELTGNQVDQLISNKDIVIPTPIDSSQLAAVIEATEGNSFVLHGPPGTGKSQTITTMIANILNQNKSVLFVAEKRAALNVVYDRLTQIGLEDFCLEIHSNKTSRRTVLSKFENNLSLNSDFDFDNYEQRNKRLEIIKNELNEELFALHEIQKSGYSVYNLISKLEELNEDMNLIDFSLSDVSDLTKSNIEHGQHIINLITKLLAASNLNVIQHPLKDFSNKNYSVANKEKLVSDSEQLLLVLDELNLDINKKWINKDYEIADQLIRKIEDRNMKAKLEKSVWNKLLDHDYQNYIDKLIVSCNEYSVLRNDVYSTFSTNVDSVNLINIKQDYLKAKSAFLLKGSKTKTALAPLNSITKNFIVDENNFDSVFTKLMTYFDLKNDINTRIRNLESNLNYKFDNFDIIDSIEDVLEFIKEVHIISNKYDVDTDEIFDIYEHCTKQDIDKIKSILENNIKVRRLIENIKNIVGYDLAIYLNDENYNETIKDKLNVWLNNLEMWKDYSLMYEYILELGNVCGEKIKVKVEEHLKTNDIDYTEFEQIFVLSIFDKLTKLYIEENSSLTRFNVSSTVEKIKEYNRLVDCLEEISKEKVRNTLINNLPFVTKNDEFINRELANLNKVIRSKGRATSIRKIFKENGNVIKKITPCMLMSPLSVAQYIDLDFPKFDVIIFDEASQIRTGVAVGAMSRAENCIIVGDPNQMPPTAFFNTQKLDEDNMHIEDLESLLEDCLAINMPQRRLSCHYRSKSESLIAFSNSMYYGNKMLTFPAPDDSVSKVTFKKVPGVYDRGGTRTNRIEAEEIVREIIRRLNDEKLSKETIGVVTFNAAQQELIDDILQTEFLNNPRLEKIASKMREPIFIKNLENVQGDERDVILFSITFGKDKNDKFYQNFGPLGKKGGWRRLNVAVSRSRVEMVVISSLTFDEITITPASSEGVVSLKKFLEFAQKGIEILKTRKDTNNNLEDNIIKSINKVLKENGYQTVINFGVSNLTLDIVVENPKQPGQYLCAILLDGLNYYNFGSSRDRNRLLDSVLSRKGWNIYRFWTMDYFENQDNLMRNLLDYLNQLVENYIPYESVQKESSSGLLVFEKNRVEEQCELEESMKIEIEDKITEQLTIVDNSTEKNNLEKVRVYNNPNKTLEIDNIELLNKSRLINDNVNMTEISNSTEESQEKNILLNHGENIKHNILFTSTNDEELIEEENNTTTTEEINTVDTTENLSNAPGTAEKQVVKITATTYVKADINKSDDVFVADVHGDYIRDIAMGIIQTESPIMEELLVRRVLEHFKDSKLTVNITNIILNSIKKIKVKKAKENNGVIYYGEIDPKEYFNARIPSEDYRRDIDNISLAEIANMIAVVVNESNNIVGLNEEHLIKETIRKFGFARSTSKIYDRVSEGLGVAIKKKWFKRNRKQKTLELLVNFINTSNY